jgi:hypothetical protein
MEKSLQVVDLVEDQIVGVGVIVKFGTGLEGGLGRFAKRNGGGFVFEKRKKILAKARRRQDKGDAGWLEVVGRLGLYNERTG